VCRQRSPSRLATKEIRSVSVRQWQEGQERTQSHERSASLGLLAYLGRSHHIARRTHHCRSYYDEHRQDHLQKVYISLFFQSPSDSRGGASLPRRGLARGYKGYLLLPKVLSTTTSKRFGEHPHETGLIVVSGVNGGASMFTTMRT